MNKASQSGRKVVAMDGSARALTLATKFSVSLKIEAMGKPDAAWQTLTPTEQVLATQFLAMWLHVEKKYPSYWDFSLNAVDKGKAYNAAADEAEKDLRAGQTIDRAPPETWVPSGNRHTMLGSVMAGGKVVEEKYKNFKIGGKTLDMYCYVLARGEVW